MSLNTVLNLQPLTGEAFAVFGDVLSADKSASKIINKGFAEKHYELCTLDSSEKGGLSALHIYVAKARQFPLMIDMMEKHPYFSQVFMPRSKEPFVVVVALGEEEPDTTTIKAFISSGNEGVQYRRGIWHFPLISIKDNEQFIVLDRTDDGMLNKRITECIEHYFEDEKFILELKD